jgi:hypothetical protein
LTGENQNLQTQITTLSNDYAALRDLTQELSSLVETLVDENALLKEEITILEDQVTNHSHSYLTGEGKGHNSTNVLTGPATFSTKSESAPEVD